MRRSPSPSQQLLDLSRQGRGEIFIGILIFLIFIFLIVCSYFFLDQQLIIFISQHLNSQQIFIFNLISQIGNGLVPLVIFGFGFLIFRFLKLVQAQKYCLYLLSVFIASGLICDVLKNILGRVRPELLIHKDLFGFYFFKFHSAYWSCPSGHSATLGACFMGLFLIFKNCKFNYLFLILGFLISSCRVLALAHYPSDVLAGFYLGCVTAYFIFTLFFEKLKIKKVRNLKDEKNKSKI